MEVEVNAESCLHTEPHSRVLRASAWSEFDSGELGLEQNRGLKNNGLGGLFAGISTLLLSCIGDSVPCLFLSLPPVRYVMD